MVAFDPAIYQAAQDRARLVMTAKSVSETKPEGWIAGGKECNYCPFTKPCGVERRNLPFQQQPVDPQFAAEMTDMARELQAGWSATATVADAAVRAWRKKSRPGCARRASLKYPGF